MEQLQETTAKLSTTERVMLWTAPRCISTAFERAFIERGDCQVYHEPFGQPFHYGEEAMTSRKTFLEKERCKETYASVAQQVFNDPPASGKKYVFVKDMAYYLKKELVPTDTRITHSILIRHPARAVKSLYVKTGQENIDGFNYFDPAEAGFVELHGLWKRLTDAGLKVTIVDADELLLNPSGIMKSYCESTGILPYNEEMLTWQKGSIPEWDCWAGWHDDALESTGIMKRDKSSAVPDVSQLPELVQKTISDALPLYEEMYAKRIQVQTDTQEESKISESPNSLNEQKHSSSERAKEEVKFTV